MTKNRKNAGFTLAEMLIVVAIVVVLMGVAFVAVQDHQRSMTRLEFDTIAKEIFFAAQNHLTTAQSQGYLENNEFGHAGTKTADDPANVKDEDIFYLVWGRTGDNYPIMDLMLPPYAVDATVMGGSVIIRYQPSTAKVLDVFYSLDGKSSMLTVSGLELTKEDYATLMGNSPNYRDGTDGASNREKYKNHIVGWYGGEPAAETGVRLNAPTFEVINEDTLHVRISDPNPARLSPLPNGYSLKLIVIGKSSKAEKYFDLINYSTGENQSRVTKEAEGVYDVLLDDITGSDSKDSKDNRHFAALTHDKPEVVSGFIPGEDLIIKAVAYCKSSLANIAMSAEKTTNSLFADPIPYETGKAVQGSDVDHHVAGIASVRHLENLDANISALGKNSNASTDVTFSSAAQLNDLSWTSFRTKVASREVVPLASGITVETGCYVPVTPQYESGSDKLIALKYDGQNHSVSDVKVNFAGYAGLFGSLTKSGSEVSGSEVKNLELIDCEITGTTGAGALIGTAKNTTVTNVLARHTDKADAYKTATVKATGGDAGGLIGTAEACTVEKSAAALVVEGSVSAGGLIGSTTGGSVTGCYSGGHTYSGVPTGAKSKYASHTFVYPVRYYDAYGTPLYNVTGATAGGLIGAAGTTTVDKSYSTCSASGTTSAGGFVGTSSGKLTDCYCTGLVGGTDTGAFAYSVSATASDVQGCRYFEIINEKADTVNGGYTYLSALGGSATNANITPFDADASSYNTFTRVPAGDVAEAKPYDADGTAAYGLNAFYTADGKTRYILRTVSDLGATLSADDYVNVHYGDWPAPEEFVFN